MACGDQDSAVENKIVKEQAMNLRAEGLERGWEVGGVGGVGCVCVYLLVPCDFLLMTGKGPRHYHKVPSPEFPVISHFMPHIAVLRLLFLCFVSSFSLLF